MRVTFPTQNLMIALVALAIVGCTNGRIKTGDKMYENLSYSKAAEKYEKALKSRPDNTDLKLKLANSYRNLNNSVASEKYFRQVADSIGLAGEDKLYYAQALMRNNKHDQAKLYLESYLQENPDDQLAKDLLASSNAVEELKEDTAAYMLTPLPLDFTVSMFGPAHYGNGLVFAGETEITSASSTNPWTGYSYLDMFYMEKDAQGYWNVPVNFSDVLNGKFHDGPAAFNGDQDMIVFTRSAMKNTKKQLVNDKSENQFFLYTSKKIDGKWTEPELMPFNDVRYSVGHPTLSADGKTLYFSSDMPGGYGGSDIYVSTFDGTNWSEPLNLGSTINTPGNEVFPFIAKDGQLYFSSEGHQTLGGLDVFVSSEKGGVWSRPVNLAYPLNSSQDDFAFIVNDNDTTGYVSSNRSGVDMIYGYTKIPPVFILDGIASIKSQTNPIEGVLITLINVTDGDTARVTTTDNGKFKFNLLPEKQYKVVGEKPGYFKQSEEFTTGKKSHQQKIAFGFEVDEIVESESGTSSGTSSDGSGAAAKVYEIGEVFYDYNESTIRPDAQPKLDKLAVLLKDNPSISIEIQSHSDSRGSDAFNNSLSNRRAQAVVDYLVAKGISKSRLKSKGFGESRLVNKCVDGVECTEAEHQLNRRTEFIVLKSGK